MAGLLAANMLQRRNTPLTIHERAASLPNNHSAVLRFRSSLVGDTLGIPFKKVTMLKTIDGSAFSNPVKDTLSYSYKCLGTYLSDRSIVSGTVVDERWIAPPDFIWMMASRVGDNIKYISSWHAAKDDDGAPVISTIPMPALMKMLGYEREIEFKSRPGINVRAKVADCDAYVTVYCPRPHEPFSRVSITGDELIIECPGTLVDLDLKEWLPRAAAKVGIPEQALSGVQIFPQSYQKIQPIDENERKRFISWATDKHGIFSLGRFATWRPGLLLDDLVNDVRLIERWMNSKYDLTQHRIRAAV